ncbi:hypothetical protein BV25DRAFT_1821796 [Artomyces pyxidatus]|uniref:Uncharacterized protein n=1 Tax=Artomyces pyxidatus TaxID=48021 RepID=A0ACB8TB47_9AGAM|nr:hypothetical protein BV25DRAFT_1821796 [Artomyces pyxidatus]
MSTVINVGPTWKGFKAIKNLIIFGDSYSAVGYDARCPKPSSENPIGLPLPGITYNEPDKFNWVGHLITSYCNNRSDILVYDYAIGGQTVSGVCNQVDRQFLSSIGPKIGKAWNASDALFVTWVGINDCAFISNPDHIASSMEVLFTSQESLYAAGVRNFLFIDIPPVHRTPAYPARPKNETSSENFPRWNAELRSAIQEFFSKYRDITVMVYSAWHTFSRVLDDPTPFDFPADHVRKAFGKIWYDNLHPTSAMHEIVAQDMSVFLHDVSATVAEGLSGTEKQTPGRSAESDIMKGCTCISS